MRKCKECGIQLEDWVRFCPMDGSLLNEEAPITRSGSDKRNTDIKYKMAVDILNAHQFTVKIDSNREPDPLWSETAEIFVCAVGYGASEVKFLEKLTNVEFIESGLVKSETGFFHFSVEHEFISVKFLVECPTLELKGRYLLWVPPVK